MMPTYLKIKCTYQMLPDISWKNFQWKNLPKLYTAAAHGDKLEFESRGCKGTLYYPAWPGPGSEEITSVGLFFYDVDETRVNGEPLGSVCHVWVKGSLTDALRLAQDTYTMDADNLIGDTFQLRINGCIKGHF